MKLLKSIYEDSYGCIWEVTKFSLPKKKGYYNYWIAECKSLNIVHRGNKKKDLIKAIEEINQKSKQLIKIN